MGSKQHELMQFFTWAHLPEHLQAVSRPFGELAQELVGMTIQERHGIREEDGGGYIRITSLIRKMERDLPSNTEATWCVTKLDKARDAVVEHYHIDSVLRRVLEAKDCAVRALVYKPTTEAP